MEDTVKPVLLEAVDDFPSKDIPFDQYTAVRHIFPLSGRQIIDRNNFTAPLQESRRNPASDKAGRPRYKIPFLHTCTLLVCNLSTL